MNFMDEHMNMLMYGCGSTPTCAGHAEPTWFSFSLIHKDVNEYTSRWQLFAFVNEGMNGVFVSGILWGHQSHWARLWRAEGDMPDPFHMRRSTPRPSWFLFAFLESHRASARTRLQAQDVSVNKFSTSGKPINQHIHPGNIVANRTKTDNGHL